MSFSSLRTVGLSVTASSRTFHTTSSYRHLKMLSATGADFFRSLHSPNILNPAQNWFNSPQLISQCLETETCLKERGYYPFYHATPASAGLLINFSEVLYGKKPPRPFFKYLRPPTGPFNLSREESFNQLNLGREEQKPNLLSVSYSLTSGLKPRESAAAFAFVNHYGTEPYFQMVSSYNELLNASSLSPTTHEYFMEKGLRWIQKACSRQVGDIHLIGLRNLANVYDSGPYNIPTGRRAQDVIKNPERHTDTLLSQGTLMATIVYNREMNLDEEIVMVTANDPKEVAALKRERPSLELSQVPYFREIVSPVETDFERRENELRNKLQNELEVLKSEFSEALSNPDFTPPAVEEMEETRRGFSIESLP